MHRASLLRLALAGAIVAALGLASSAPVHAASIGFRGGDTDHFWNVNITFCKDGFKVSGVEILHADGGNGDDKPFSLVLSRTTTLVTSALAARIGGGDGSGGPNRPLATATAYFTYTVAQAPGTSTQITLERWEHGDNNADDDTGDFSVGDDREIIDATIANCTLITPPAFDVPPSPQQGGLLTASPGTPLSFVVEASDADGLDAVTLGAASIPAGASFSIPGPANPATSTFSWTPTPAQVGRHVLRFTATDSTGRSAAVYSVTVDVQFRIRLPLVATSSTSASNAAVGSNLGLDQRASHYSGKPS